MKKIFFAFFILLMLTGSLFAWTKEEVSQFQEANHLYREGKHAQAIPIYEKLSELHPDAAVFLYNLGNSYYRTRALGKAIRAYERARLFDPRNPDIKSNLNYVRSLLEYRLDDKRNWYIRAGEHVLELFASNEIYFGLALSYFLFIASCVFGIFIRRGMSWGWKRKTFLFIFLIFVLLALAKHVEKDVIRDAIVMTNDAEVRYGPSDSDQVAFRLGEGLKVYVVDEREDWSRVLLVNGETGWMKNSQIGLIK